MVTVEFGFIVVDCYLSWSSIGDGRLGVYSATLVDRCFADRRNEAMTSCEGQGGPGSCIFNKHSVVFPRFTDRGRV